MANSVDEAREEMGLPPMQPELPAADSDIIEAPARPLFRRLGRDLGLVLAAFLLIAAYKLSSMFIAVFALVMAAFAVLRGITIVRLMCFGLISLLLFLAYEEPDHQWKLFAIAFGFGALLAMSFLNQGREFLPYVQLACAAVCFLYVGMGFVTGSFSFRALGPIFAMHEHVTVYLETDPEGFYARAVAVSLLGIYCVVSAIRRARHGVS